MKSDPAKTCPSCGERYDADVLFCPRDGTPLASVRSPSIPSSGDSYLGLELAGQIRLKHLIGIGSMGRVYKAWQAGIERDVAVKVLHRELSGNPELVSRFHREAKVASRLVHPNVVQVLMTGCLPLRADPRLGGELYLVMEHLDGISLLSALAAAGASGEGCALPLPRALRIVLQICDAVGEAHAQSIVHRDLKPENVMLVRRGDDPDYVKVLDFGIARLDWADRSMATQAGLIFGTAKYISPEGAEGQPVGPPADVYSIATILYQCLAGRTPFEGDSPVALLVQHTHTPPPDLLGIARSSYVPAPIAAVVMQNLAKKPGERAPNARQLGRDLIAAARASGLDPDEIASHSSLLLRGPGAVKLPSKERTKALELSRELAERIGAVPASGPRDEEPSAPPPERASAATTPPPTLASRASIAPVVEEHAPSSGRASHAPTSPRPSQAPSSPGSSRGARASAAPPPDFDDGGAAPLPTGTTMQGAELEATEHPRRTTRARTARFVALLACGAAAMLAIVLGGRHFGAFGRGADDSIDTYLQEGRECMRQHAWDAPTAHNVKEVTDRALDHFPNDPRVLDLRREAAERLVADALGRKYAGDVAEALHLSHLALELSPSLTTAQHLVADLEAERTPEVAPAASSEPRVEDEHTSARLPHRATPPGPGAHAKPSPSATAAPSAAPAAPPASATSTPAALPAPALPPTPPPQLPPTPPSSTGPWL